MRAPRRAFTLLEVLLSIALSTVLLALLATAINLNLLRVDNSRDTVEQAQLARGVLRAISDDLRNVAVIHEQDISSAEATAASQALFDVDEADTAPDEENAAEDSADAAGDAAAAGTTERPYAGITGDAQSLQVDVRRIRPSYTLAVDAADPPLLMSDGSPGIFTVRYLLTPEGLVRQQAQRDRRIFEEEQGRDDLWLASQQVLASEVAELRFRYHDGEQVLELWDIDEREGALPVAVQVTVGLRVASNEESDDQTQSEQAPLAYYTLTIPMPAPLEDASAAAEEESAMGGGA